MANDLDNPVGIEPQQWKAWIRQPETQAFFEDLETMRNDIVDSWACGDFTRDSVEGTAMLNAKKLGEVHMLDAILDLRMDKGA